MKIQTVASVAAITADPAASRALYVDTLGLPLERAAEDDDYLLSERLPGTNHFGVWPLTQAAQACFGRPDWPSDVPVPQACVEFEVADVDAIRTAAQELRDAGYEMLHDAREEPWGQVVARLLSPEHLVVGISYMPWKHG
ncbi:VOC family protein [Pseudonocardia nematodicida]|uniref:VOC family protein n=1 Tax=Pseudonocardia nematodicida TaxID=1206997 RepID=A0ABV1KFZ2_9PSEU